MTVWRTIDFRPAAPGWDVIYLDDEEPQGFEAVPLAGWLIQEEARSDWSADTATPSEDRDRRAVAAEAPDGLAMEIDFDSTPGAAWYLRGPGQPDPTATQIATERARRARADARKAEPT